MYKVLQRRCMTPKTTQGYEHGRWRDLATRRSGRHFQAVAIVRNPWDRVMFSVYTFAKKVMEFEGTQPADYADAIILRGIPRGTS